MKRQEFLRVGILLSAYCLLLSADVSAQVPHLVRYQGQAVDTKGVPLEGPYTLTFRLYDDQTGGTKLWEERQDNVVLTSGNFSVLLGQKTSLESIDWDVPCWLSVQVNAEPELSPRQQITSVPLAIRSKEAEKLTQAITPNLITPQGSSSGLDADTVDSKHALDLLNRANHTGTQPSSTITGTFAPSVISPQGDGSGLNADTVDGLEIPGHVAVLSGVVSDGDSLPLPSGFSESQCRWIVSPTSIFGMGGWDSNDAFACGTGSFAARSQDTGWTTIGDGNYPRRVTCRHWDSNFSTNQNALNANYLIICVK